MKTETKPVNMKIKHLLLAGAIGYSLLNGLTASAQTTPPTPPPTVIPPGDKDLFKDLQGAPPEIQKLIIGFDALRDKYLAEQRELLHKLKKATPEEREKIRKELADNREDFLEKLKAFRAELREDLKDLKGKISHEEFQRILDAARDATGQHHRRGAN